MVTQPKDPRDHSDVANSHSILINQPVIIRTISMYYTGKLVQLTDTDLVLDDCTWIADTGPWGECLNKGNISEGVRHPEPTIINRSMLVDMMYWPHELPTCK